MLGQRRSGRAQGHCEPFFRKFLGDTRPDIWGPAAGYGREDGNGEPSPAGEREPAGETARRQPGRHARLERDKCAPRGHRPPKSQPSRRPQEPEDRTRTHAPELLEPGAVASQSPRGHLCVLLLLDPRLLGRLQRRHRGCRASDRLGRGCGVLGRGAPALPVPRRRNKVKEGVSDWRAWRHRHTHTTTSHRDTALDIIRATWARWMRRTAWMRWREEVRTGSNGAHADAGGTYGRDEHPDKQLAPRRLPPPRLLEKRLHVVEAVEDRHRAPLLQRRAAHAKVRSRPAHRRRPNGVYPEAALRRAH